MHDFVSFSTWERVSRLHRKVARMSRCGDTHTDNRHQLRKKKTRTRFGLYALSRENTTHPFPVISRIRSTLFPIANLNGLNKKKPISPSATVPVHGQIRKKCNHFIFLELNTVLLSSSWGNLINLAAVMALFRNFSPNTYLTTPLSWSAIFLLRLATLGRHGSSVSYDEIHTNELDTLTARHFSFSFSLSPLFSSGTNLPEVCLTALNLHG